MISRKRIILNGIFLLIALFFIACNQLTGKKTISLSGEWQFQTDPGDVGIVEKWCSQKLQKTIHLPGSMIENGKGEDPTIETKWTGSIYDSSWYFSPQMEKYRQPGNIKFPFWLTPNKYYVGPAWYRKEMVIPQSWDNQRIVLYLERPHWETTVWVDSLKIGMQNSLSTPHQYDLTKLITPGTHTISIRVDNRIKDINVGPDSHSLTDHTQGNWNGIVGDIKIEAGSPVFFDDVKLYPDINSKSIRVVMQIKKCGEKPVSGEIKLSAESFNTASKHKVKPLTATLNIDNNKILIELIYPMGEDVQLWDEFDPALYKLTAVLTDESGNTDIETIQFGMREFNTNGIRFEINGRPTFLRGTVECCAFPLTGYPPTDVASWDRVFRICRAYGLNHIRFHSWCPPEAAFIAADKAGFYLHVEGPSWANHGTSLGDGKPIDQYIYDETERIVDAYGNHPSFCMMAYGNEPAGINQVKYLGEFVNYWKAKDNRRVYTSASIGMSWSLVPESEFIVRSGPRGLPWDERPQSMFDYRQKIQQETVPYVAHEMGQYCVFPNFKEVGKYTGVYRAKNFELFQEDLNDHHMGDQAEDFLMASGKLQALCYKSEIEAALRTPGFAGVQLLSLNDFPGQGTALVGVLDAFWDEKGYITSNEFNRFCSYTVPLARIQKFVYTNDETLKADIEVFHFGKQPLHNVTPKWAIIDEQGSLVKQGIFDTKNILIGNCISLGSICVPLAGITRATKLNLEVMIDDFANDWDFWVYPAASPQLNTDNIYFCSELDERAEQALKNGGKVFLHASGKVENGKDVVQYFKPVFWNTSWFQMRPPHTLGILCNPQHPALENFPTEYHSNLQWWEILDRQQVMCLDNFLPEFRPLVQPIDTWFLNRRLGLIFEARVGNGKLIVSSADLQTKLNERPVARQLLFSLIDYMKSDQFDPQYTVDLSIIKEVFEKKDRVGIHFYTKETTDDLKPKF